MRDPKFEMTKQTLFRLARQPARDHQEEADRPRYACPPARPYGPALLPCG